MALVILETLICRFLFATLSKEVVKSNFPEADINVSILLRLASVLGLTYCQNLFRQKYFWVHKTFKRLKVNIRNRICIHIYKGSQVTVWAYMPHRGVGVANVGVRNSHHYSPRPVFNYPPMDISGYTKKNVLCNYWIHLKNITVQQDLCWQAFC